MTTRSFEIAGSLFDLELDEGQFQTNPAMLLTLPVALVSGMSSASYMFPEQKQAILDALSPFQIASKLWSSIAANNLLIADDNIENVVFVGSWFGQQSAIMARSCRDYSKYKVTLVDKDPIACRVAQHLIKCDSYHRRVDPAVWVKDIFDLRVDPHTLFVWNGLEHFDSNDVETFLERNTESTFLFQSTSMPAKDHTNLASDIEDLFNVVPAGWDEGVAYKGVLHCEGLGHRYMMAIRGPGVEPPEDDGQDFADYNEDHDDT